MLEKSKKNLKIVSYVILALVLVEVAWTVISFIVSHDSLLAAAKDTAIELKQPENFTDTIMTIMYVFLGIYVAITLSVGLYLGLRGLGLANGKYSGKAYMVWLIIMAIIGALGIVSSASTLIKGTDVVWNYIISIFVDVIFTSCLVLSYIEAGKIRDAQ